MFKITPEKIQNQTDLVFNIAPHWRLFKDPCAIGGSSLKMMGVAGQLTDRFDTFMGIVVPAEDSFITQIWQGKINERV